jgi:hypothetical protein
MHTALLQIFIGFHLLSSTAPGSHSCCSSGTVTFLKSFSRSRQFIISVFACSKTLEVVCCPFVGLTMRIALCSISISWAWELTLWARLHFVTCLCG